MTGHVRDAWETLVPPPDSPHGPLSPLLVLLTVVTGLVDAFSYLQLGRVFVANMTGNVVFLAFATGGAPGFVWWASLLAIFTFIGGAFIGGRIAHSHRAHRGRHLLLASAVQTVVVLTSVAVAFALGAPYDDKGLVVLIILLGTGMGVQNATARALAVPDLTTTVLTLTITGISADSSAAGGSSSKVGRRLVSILSMFAGALIGVLLVEAGHGSWVLVVVGLLLATVAFGAFRTISSNEPWVAAP
ncbi:MAG: hypothetical protein JWP74_1557 [Marmoricola sp.]|nr:hypothetical protein [Marmoricola sp.]